MGRQWEAWLLQPQVSSLSSLLYGWEQMFIPGGLPFLSFTEHLPAPEQDHFVLCQLESTVFIIPQVSHIAGSLSQCLY